MKILVTGGAGYIGCVLVDQLLERGHEVRVLDRLYWGRKPIECHADQIELIHGDVRSFDESILDGIDGVAHLAGLSNDPTSEYNPAANWEMNTVATENLAIACKKRAITRFTFGSSCSIYDGLPSGPVYDETAEVQPRGAYATSKRAAEEALVALTDDRFRPAILRQGTVYGWSPRMRLDLVVNTFVKDAVTKGALSLHGGGWMWRPLVDVHDVARAHLECLEANPELVGGEIFNLVHDNYQIRELAMLVAGSAIMRTYTVALRDGPLPQITRDYKCDRQKIQKRIGFTSRISVLESIETMLHAIEGDPSIDVNHPRYYNIAWMTLLEEAHAAMEGFKSVF